MKLQENEIKEEVHHVWLCPCSGKHMLGCEGTLHLNNNN